MGYIFILLTAAICAYQHFGILLLKQLGFNNLGMVSVGCFFFFGILGSLMAPKLSRHYSFKEKFIISASPFPVLLFILWVICNYDTQS